MLGSSATGVSMGKDAGETLMGRAITYAAEEMPYEDHKDSPRNHGTGIQVLERS